MFKNVLFEGDHYLTDVPLRIIYYVLFIHRTYQLHRRIKLFLQPKDFSVN